MRRWAGLQLVVICGVGAACAAHAQTAAPIGVTAAQIGPKDQLTSLLDQASPESDATGVRWRSTQVKLTPNAKLRVTLADPGRAPGVAGVPLTRLAAEPQAYEVSVVREWPAALSVKGKKLGLDLSPHAGVGLTPYGGMAEAGARLELGKRMDDAAREGLAAIGVGDGARFGDKGRWYLFAAASGRAVGLNMLRGDGGWNRAGWTTDESSKLVGDAQVGVGWRKGAMQTSLGVLHREVKGEHTYYGYQSKPDTLMAISFAVRPGQ